MKQNLYYPRNGTLYARRANKEEKQYHAFKENFMDLFIQKLMILTAWSIRDVSGDDTDSFKDVIDSATHATQVKYIFTKSADSDTLLLNMHLPHYTDVFCEAFINGIKERLLIYQGWNEADLKKKVKDNERFVLFIKGFYFRMAKSSEVSRIPRLPNTQFFSYNTPSDITYVITVHADLSTAL